MRPGIAAATLLAVAAPLGCVSDPAPAPSSALRRDAAAALESGHRRLAGRHYAAAARSFGRAAEIHGALDEPAAMAAALRNQAEALRLAGQLADATAGFERALALDRDAGREASQARDRAGLARCHADRGDVEQAIREVEQALALAPAADALRTSLELDLAVYLLARGDADDAERIAALLGSARDRATAADEPRSAAAAHLHLGRLRARFDSPDAARQELERALDTFRALDDAEGIARSHEALGHLHAANDQPAAAASHLEQARRGYAFLGDEAALARVDDLLAQCREGLE